MTAFVEGQVQFFTHGVPAAPLQKYPSDAGLAYEEVWFPAIDGVQLEAWYIPCPGAKRIILCNHPMTWNKGGLPKEDISFIPDYEHLHKAGYAVLTYDLRNHGRSGNSWGKGIIATGAHESRDVAGAMRFLKSWEETKGMEVGLFMRCMGADAAIAAFKQYPKDLASAHAMVALQPVSARTFIEVGAKNAGLDPEEAVRLFDQGVWKEIGLRITDLEPQSGCDAVEIPTLVVQVRDDARVNARKDTQEIFDKLATDPKDKKLFWIEGTTERYDGYTYFGTHPEELLGWFAKYFPAK